MPSQPGVAHRLHGGGHRVLRERDRRASPPCDPCTPSGSKSFTSHAKCTGNAAASNFVIGAAPECPVEDGRHVVATSLPTGVRHPMPVTTTRRFIRRRLRIQVLDRIADGPELLGVLVGNVDVELLLELHHELDDVETIGAKVLDEARFGGELLAFDAEFFLDDVLDLRCNDQPWTSNPRLREGCESACAKYSCAVVRIRHITKPAVHHEDLAGDVRRRIRSQKGAHAARYPPVCRGAPAESAASMPCGPPSVIAAVMSVSMKPGAMRCRGCSATPVPSRPTS